MRQEPQLAVEEVLVLVFRYEVELFQSLLLPSSCQVEEYHMTDMLYVEKTLHLHMIHISNHLP